MKRKGLCGGRRMEVSCLWLDMSGFYCSVSISGLSIIALFLNFYISGTNEQKGPPRGPHQLPLES